MEFIGGYYIPQSQILFDYKEGKGRREHSEQGGDLYSNPFFFMNCLNFSVSKPYCSTRFSNEKKIPSE